MGRFVLHHRAHHISLPVGEFVVGSGKGCRLVLDDPEVSSRHAIFRVAREGISVQALGSAHGVQVNGVAITGVRPLSDKDTVTIGAQEFRIGLIETRKHQPINLEPTEDTLSDGTTDNEKDVLLQMAAKSLAAGRADDASVFLRRFLARQLRQLRKGRAIDQLPEAADYALRLASATGDASWFEWVFEAYAACDKLVPVALIDQLYTVIRIVRKPNIGTLRDYVTKVHTHAEQMNPSERFALQRLDGLVRVAQSM